MKSMRWLTLLLPLALTTFACASETTTDPDADDDADTSSEALSAGVFDPASCAGPGLTNRQMVALVPPGATRTTLGALSLRSRNRTCTNATGCTAWSTPKKAHLTPNVDLFVVAARDGRPAYPTVTLDFKSCVGRASGKAVCIRPYDASQNGRFWCGDFDPHARGEGGDCNSKAFGKAGDLFVSGTCMRFTGKDRMTVTRDQWTEYEYAAVSAR